MAFYYKQKSPLEIYAEGQGLLAESFPKIVANGSAAFTSGDVRGSLIALRAGTVVTNIHVGVAATAAGTVTTIKAGLYDKSGNRLARSANSTTALDATQSIATLAMEAAYTVPANDVYYAVILVVAGTMPTLMRLGSNSPFHLAVGSGKPVGVNEAGQTDLDATCVLGGTALSYWFGVS